MSIFGNILWIIFGGILLALYWFFFGILLCLTIIFIPFGLQFFKFGKLSLFPFGKDITTNFEKHPVLNVIWLLTFGIGTTIFYAIIGGLLFITIIGIPFAKQWFKLSKLTLLPFGATIK